MLKLPSSPQEYQESSHRLVIKRLPSFGDVFSSISSTTKSIEHVSPSMSPKIAARYDRRTMEPLNNKVTSAFHHLPPLNYALCHNMNETNVNLPRLWLKRSFIRTDKVIATTVIDGKETIAMKPTKKRPRKSVGAVCRIENCTKKAKTGGLCICHGGGLRCSIADCHKHAVTMGLCIAHGGGKRCQVSGCQNAARKSSLCWSHGGRKLCKVQGCRNGTKIGGYCWSHRHRREITN